MAVKIVVADATHVKYAQDVCDLIRTTAQQKGSGIVDRSPDYVTDRIKTGRAVIAFDEERVVGFVYIETWSHGMFVANSGLVVDSDYRYKGLARQIKKSVFELSRKLYPTSKIFSITTGLAVMKLNSELGYVPVTYSELTRDIEFWQGCEGCKNFDILQRNNYKMCLCTGLVFDPAKQKDNKERGTDVVPQKLPFNIFFVRPYIFTKRIFQRLYIMIKRYKLLKKINKINNNKS